jgi:hypothetical protein
MLAWLLWRLERIERIHEAARRLIGDYGDKASAEARRRAREANSAEAARDWKRVAAVIGRRTRKPVALDAATGPTPMEFDPVAEPTTIASDPPRAFRMQFFCATPDHGQRSLTEKEIEAEDTSAAIVAAASTEWPPRTIGLWILDREGREVFAREKASRG